MNGHESEWTHSKHNFNRENTMLTRFMLTAATSALIASGAAADYTLTFLHTNDIHSRVESINKYGSTCNADGDVTMDEVLTVLPFQNTLSTFFVSGATIVAALENGVSKMEEGAGRFPQVAGMSFTVNSSAEEGSRISNVMVSGSAIDLNKTYGVVSNNYVRNGGDGYKMFRDAENAYDYGPDLVDVTAEYIAKGGSYTAYTDGRIKVK
jgi:2',3'-cyclic-nucleotide 2'-phosphodiesterase (5'-nucleotidase family)